jgi:hypothetical protein
MMTARDHRYGLCHFVSVILLAPEENSLLIGIEK